MTNDNLKYTNTHNLIFKENYHRKYKVLHHKGRIITGKTKCFEVFNMVYRVMTIFRNLNLNLEIFQRNLIFNHLEAMNNL